ncbi:hypothetical protein [Streptomyces sudanensis]|uniref:hypothetical protein n=1 Tax=Streptomyces sudanensis TaxID=436397 RepID=UPI0020CDB430|nr:hypothetical protein [Streptomyces sudanensis]MCP9956809.1 hypothetical protein [Streptomyces sudanensis]MCQ0002604.1 hypothetical protein [Streptomyces sudanensis]
MWEGCTPLLGTELDPLRHEITGWELPGIGEIDIESEGYRMSVLPADGSLRFELAFSNAYTESASAPYLPLGPVSLVLEAVRYINVETLGAPAEPLWKRVLRGDSHDELLRMVWDERNDVLHVRNGSTVLTCQGGTWHWQLDGEAAV